MIACPAADLKFPPLYFSRGIFCVGACLARPLQTVVTLSEFDSLRFRPQVFSEFSVVLPGGFPFSK